MNEFEIKNEIQNEFGKLTHISFNDSRKFFVVATEKRGFHIFKVDPFQHRLHKQEIRRKVSGEDNPQKRIKYKQMRIVEMIASSNLIGIVTPDGIFIHDLKENEIFGEVEEARDVLSIKFTSKYLVILFCDSIDIYRMDDLTKKYWSVPCGKQIFESTTHENDKGDGMGGNVEGKGKNVILSVSKHKDSDVVTTLSSERDGYCVVLFLNEKRKKHFYCHQHSIQCLCLNDDGTVLASASEKGTIIRIFDTLKGHKITECRRGIKSATIYTLAFSKDSTDLVCYSDRGTVHVFDVGTEIRNSKNPSSSSSSFFWGGKKNDVVDDETMIPLPKKKKNRTSKLRILSYLGIFGYIDSQWSKESHHSVDLTDEGICVFGPDDPNNELIYILTKTGYLTTIQFDLNGNLSKIHQEWIYMHLPRSIFKKRKLTNALKQSIPSNKIVCELYLKDFNSQQQQKEQEQQQQQQEDIPEDLQEEEEREKEKEEVLGSEFHGEKFLVRGEDEFEFFKNEIIKRMKQKIYNLKDLEFYLMEQMKNGKKIEYFKEKKVTMKALHEKYKNPTNGNLQLQYKLLI